MKSTRPTNAADCTRCLYCGKAGNALVCFYNPPNFAATKCGLADCGRHPQVFKGEYCHHFTPRKETVA